MKKEYDFSNARRGPLKIPKGKTRVTMYLDDAVIESFRAKSEKTGLWTFTGGDPAQVTLDHAGYPVRVKSDEVRLMIDYDTGVWYEHKLADRLHRQRTRRRIGE